MDTKSKNASFYAPKLKAAAVLVFLISLLAIFISFVVYNNLNRNWNDDVFSTDNYYSTENFHQRFFSLLDDVCAVYIEYQDEERIQTGELLSRDELIQSFKEYYNVIDGVITKSTEINENYDGLIVKEAIPLDLQARFFEYQSLVEDRLPQYRRMRIQDQLEDFHYRRRTLDTYKNFLFYLEDGRGRKVAGNVDKEVIESEKRSIALNGSFMSGSLQLDNEGYYRSYSNTTLSNSKYRLYAAISDPLMPSDPFFAELEEYQLAKQVFPALLLAGVISCALLLLSFAYLVRVAGQNEKSGEVHFLSVDSIYNDLHAGLMFFCGIVSALMGGFLLQSIMYRGLDFWSYIFSTVLAALLLADGGLFLNYVLSVVRQVKGRRFLRNTMVAAAIRKLGMLFSGKTYRGWTVFLLLGYSGVNCFLAMFLGIGFYEADDGMILLILMLLFIFNMICITLFVKALRSIAKIMSFVRETSQGNLKDTLDIGKISPSFLRFALDVSNIQNGLKMAVEKAVKEERMKAELVTNVSHDLKTPLTSIITYVDLLTKENIPNESAQSYIQVLYDKSYRLKQLIEDLIEASKASSGNLPMTPVCVDLKELVMQGVGEMEQKIEQAGLNFKVNCERETSVYADGRHMWRIMENLFSNVIKYSMPHSRVYVDILQTEEWGILVVKNISENPIEVSHDLLTERFVRGDAARTTEGSGLGLSITKSLSALQGGQFEIQVDGDLFKAIVKMPLWKGRASEAKQEE